MASKDIIYGANSSETTEVPVSFAYGSITAAAADTTPGSINFGYDDTVKAGAIYRMGKLVTSKILDITLTDTDTADVKSVTVEYVDTDGVVREKVFNAVDKSLIDTLIVNQGKLYVGSEFINVDGSTRVVSINYDTLYSNLKNSLAADGIGNDASINLDQSERIEAIESQYVTSISKSDVEKDASTYNVNVDIKKKIADSSVVDRVTFKVPTDNYYNSIDASLKNIDSKFTEATTENSSEIKSVQKSYVSSVSTDSETVDKSAKTYNVTLNVSKKDDSDEVTSNIVSFKVPTDRYYDKVDASLNNMNSKFTEAIAENSSKIDNIEEGYVSSLSTNSDTVDATADTYDITVNIKKKSENTDSEEKDTITDTSVLFKVPTDNYYTKVDSSIKDLTDKIMDVSTVASKPVDSLVWLDVKDLLNNLTKD